MQYLVLLFVREISEVKPTCVLLQHHGAEHLTHGLDHAALNLETKICDYQIFFHDHRLLYLHVDLQQLNLVGCERGDIECCGTRGCHPVGSFSQGKLKVVCFLMAVLVLEESDGK